MTGEDVTDSSVTASIDPASIDTGNDQRDGHVRSADFFDVENYPLWTFRSTGVRGDGDGLVVDGELTIKGVTRSVPLAVEMNGVGSDMPLDGGGGVVGDKVQITLEIEAVLRQAWP